MAQDDEWYARNEIEFFLQGMTWEWHAGTHKMLGEVSGLFRKRDLFVFVLVIVTLYISFLDNQSLKYTIEPAWYIDQRISEHHDPNRGYLDDIPIIHQSNETIDYQLVRPVITDLDGDGSNEIVMITKDLKLKVPNLTYIIFVFVPRFLSIHLCFFRYIMQKSPSLIWKIYITHMKLFLWKFPR